MKTRQAKKNIEAVVQEEKEVDIESSDTEELKVASDSDVTEEIIETKKSKSAKKMQKKALKFDDK